MPGSGFPVTPLHVCACLKPTQVLA
jgi:hypothetical protein